MKVSFLFTTVAFAVQVQHQPVPASKFQPKAVPPSYDFIGALGESYHNAWKKCAQKTSTWLQEDLKLQQDNPAFKNYHYEDFKVEQKVPRAYEIFQELLGDSHYFKTPQIDNENGKFSVTFPTNLHAQLKAQTSNELPEPYAGNEQQEWITDHNHPNPADKKISYYDGVEPENLELSSQAGVLLRELFENIQATYYFCDRTLELARDSFERVSESEKAEKVEQERVRTNSQWNYVLKTQVAPMRWSLKMWTRYNVSQVQFNKVYSEIKDTGAILQSQIDELPLDEITPHLSFNFEESKTKVLEIFAHWENTFLSQLNCRFPMGFHDDAMEKYRQGCPSLFTDEFIAQGEKDAAWIWLEYAKPIFEQYKKLGHDVETAQAYLDEAEKLIYSTGADHSIRCIFIWLRTRVKTSELVPAIMYRRAGLFIFQYPWDALVLRDQLVSRFDVPKTGIYSDETFNKMMAYARDANAIQEGVNNILSESSGEEKREEALSLVTEHLENMRELNNWYYKIALQQYSWADDATAKDFSVENVNKDSSVAQFVRPHLDTKISQGFEKWVVRELEQMQMHFQRRI